MLTVKVCDDVYILLEILSNERQKGLNKTINRKLVLVMTGVSK